MKLIFGAVYTKIHNTTNEQHYYIYVPVAIKDKEGNIKYRMVDTYMIPSACDNKKPMEERIEFLEQANCGETSYKIFYGCHDFYYQNYYDLQSDNLDDNEWKLLADLHDYVVVSERETNDYKKEDVIKCIPLWHEDNWKGFGWCGCNYVKKNACKDNYRVFTNSIDRYYYSFDNYNAERIVEVCSAILKDNKKMKYGAKKEIKTRLKMAQKYLELQKEYENFCKKICG